MKRAIRFVSCLLVVTVLLAGCQLTSSSTGPDTHPSPSSGSPACFPPGDIDRMQMRVTVEIEISGIGRDEITLEGDVIVQRSDPTGTDGTEMVGELVAATLRGSSDLFGEVVAMESPIQPSPCKYVCEKPGEYRGRFDIHGWFWLPEHSLIVFSGKPVPIEGPATAIPPVGQTAKLAGDAVPLFSFSRPTGNPVGTLFRAEGTLGKLIDVKTSLAKPATAVPDMRKM